MLVETLESKNNPQHYRSDTSEWEMAKAIEYVVLRVIKEVMYNTIIFSLSCDDITSFDCQSWINVHGYIVRDWKCIALLFALKRVVEGRTSF